MFLSSEVRLEGNRLLNMKLAKIAEFRVALEPVDCLCQIVPQAVV
jgi:hypothetical protein